MTVLLRLLAEGELTAVIAHSLERLARPQSKAMEGLLKELRRRGVPLYVAKTPQSYRYDPEAGNLLGDAEAVAAASLLEWRPHDYITLPREQHH